MITCFIADDNYELEDTPYLFETLDEAINFVDINFIDCVLLSRADQPIMVCMNGEWETIN